MTLSVESLPARAAPRVHAAVRSPSTPPVPGAPPAAAGLAGVGSMALPLRFILTGVLSLLGVVGMLVARPDLLATYHYNQYIVSVTHLFVLGFALSVVMGAMYQLVPVALETRLHSERLGRWQFLVHLAGVGGMVVMFWTWNMKQVGHYGSLLALGVGLFVYNLVRTLRTVPRWNVVATAVASALGWLSLTVLAGLYLATSKCWNFSPFAAIPAMHAHAHLGAVGVFTMLIVGISYKLVPMFTLSAIRSARRAGASILLLNTGLAGFFVTTLLGSAWKLAFAGLLVAGLAVYGIELRAILRTRLRRDLDWGLRYFLTAVGLLGAVAVVGLVLCWPGLPVTEFTTQLENVYGLLGLVGVIGLGIVGMLYKIVPFLVWFRAYSPRVGRGAVPSLADLYAPALQGPAYWTFLAGLGTTAAGAAFGKETVVRVGAMLLAVSLGLTAVNLGLTLRHWFAPQSPGPGRAQAPCS